MPERLIQKAVSKAGKIVLPQTLSGDYDLIVNSNPAGRKELKRMIRATSTVEIGGIALAVVEPFAGLMVYAGARLTSLLTEDLAKKSWGLREKLGSRESRIKKH